jgi:hypothetical protein
MVSILVKVKEVDGEAEGCQDAMRRMQDEGVRKGDRGMSRAFAGEARAGQKDWGGGGGGNNLQKRKLDVTASPVVLGEGTGGACGDETSRFPPSFGHQVPPHTQI